MKERSPSRDGVGLTRLKDRIAIELTYPGAGRSPGDAVLRHATVSYLAVAFSVKESTIRRALSEMMADGFIEPIGTVKATGAMGPPRKIYSLKAVPRG